ncbi:MAG: hypothetical protein KAR20_16465, partial [Candidatus Heimdallarchaeota archaeon]|nr:hypothetical protein [Candidatus Heimdallarchaeota archaeon]
EHSSKRLVAIVLVIIFAAIVLNKVGILNFSFGEHNNDESTEKTQTNENPANTDENSATTENDIEKCETNPNKPESLYERYTKKPMRYYQYDPISLSSDYKIEVFKQFQTWLSGKLPPGVDDSNAKCKIERLAQKNDKLIVYNTPNLLENPTIPANWMLTNDNDKDCVLFVIIPPSKSPLPPEYWIKFIVHEDNVGQIYNFGLRESVKRGFIWTYNGITFE